MRAALWPLNVSTHHTVSTHIQILTVIRRNEISYYYTASITGSMVGWLLYLFSSDLWCPALVQCKASARLLQILHWSIDPSWFAAKRTRQLESDWYWRYLRVTIYSIQYIHTMCVLKNYDSWFVYTHKFLDGGIILKWFRKAKIVVWISMSPQWIQDTWIMLHIFRTFSDILKPCWNLFSPICSAHRKGALRNFFTGLQTNRHRALDTGNSA